MRITSTFIITNFLLSSAICFDSAMTGFKAERNKNRSIGKNSETKGRQVGNETPAI